MIGEQHDDRGRKRKRMSISSMMTGGARERV